MGLPGNELFWSLLGPVKVRNARLSQNACKENELWFFGAQPLDEVCGIKSLHALLDGEDCADLEN